MKNKILIFGGHGTGSVIALAIKHANSIGYKKYEFAGFLNDGNTREVAGMPVVGKFSDAQKFAKKGYSFIFTAHKIGEQAERIKLFESYSIPKDQIATFIHPNTYVSPDAVIAEGCVVMPGATISAHVRLERGVLIMNNASIGHDNLIGKHCFFTSNSCTGSYINFGEGVWIGLNATLRGRLNIGNYSAIGMGSVITKDIGNNELWIGNPARFHKHVKEKIKY